MDTLLQDLRFALRTLARSPGFAAVAVVCLALGIGVNTAVFSVVNTLLFRPLPMHEPDGVLRVYARQEAQGIDDAPFSAADIADLRARSRTLADVAGYSEGGFNLAAGGGGEPERVQGGYVSHNLFPLIGVRPALGRNFLPEEDRRGGEPVVILGHDLWMRLFAGRRDVVGQRVLLSGRPRTVVGVMPPRFSFPEVQQAWVPLEADASESRAERWIVAVGRLRPGTPLAAAEEELRMHGRRFAAEHPETNAGWSFGARRWRDTFASDELRTMMALLMAAVGLVLLIACANVANLLLARANGRRREIAVRAALGARRGRIVRQLLTESVVVALAGGTLGTLIALGWMHWLLTRIPEPLAYWMTFGIDARVLAYSAALSAATGLVFGTVPALRASRSALHEELKEGARGASPRHGRLRSLLAGGEIALAAVLLVAAGLMIRSVMAATSAELGFDTRPLLLMRTSLAGPRYDAVQARAAYLQQAEERIRALPGARDAAFASALPGDEGGVGTTAVAEGRPRAPGEETATRSVAITPSFFRMLGVPLVAGRTFTAQEAADSASTAVVVSTELARELWPGQDALGKRMRIGGQGDSWFTVVGVAPVLHYEEVGEDSPQSRRQIHVPYGRLPWRLMTLMVRADGSPAALAQPVRRTLLSADPTLPVWDVRTMEEYRRYSNWDRRLFGELFASFGLLALLLAAVGVYGVTAYAVSQRTREIGIRVALGARGADVVRLLVRQGARTVGIGVAVGIAGAWGASRALRGVLYGVAPGDPLTFVLVPLLLAAVALFAHVLPARRASRVDPVVALRAE